MTIPKPPRSNGTGAAPRGERLQKVLAAAGVASRRECEQFILDGRVEVDRKTVTELGVRVDPDRQQIRVDGEPLPRTKKVYYIVNKPAGVVSTNRDPEGRPRVIDLIETDQRLFPVGRLDRSSEGLLLVTNDGEVAQRLAHPRFGVEKTYHVRVAGHPGREQLKQLEKGVRLAEGVARAARVKVKKRLRQSTELEMVLDEGKNREIRRLLARIGHKVLRLRRVGFGPLRLGPLPPGAHRKLERDEVRALKSLLGKSGKNRKKKPHRGKGFQHA